ncbi:MAG TPA: hypothetical protein VHM92_05600 [Allosphingosinicella sp.]|nr:hypothetical protein [Allosphingosinicella sp.]
MDAQLLKRINRFLKRSRTPPTRFGRLALRDPQFVFDLRRGRTVRPPTRARLEAYLDAAERRLEKSPCRNR